MSKIITHNGNNIEIDPDKIKEFTFNIGKWDCIDLTALSEVEMKIMLQTCVKCMLKEGLGEVAEGWISVLSMKLAEKVNKKMLLLSVLSFVLSVIATLTAIFKC